RISPGKSSPAFCVSACLTDCLKFEISLLQAIDVLRGSCVTIPCSFDFEDDYEEHFNDQCERSWVYYENNEPRLSQTSTIIGNLGNKNCTTIFHNLQPELSNTYYFRLECKNPLKYTYKEIGLKIQVKDNPLLPTLTPSTLEVNEGDSVSLTCSSPAPSNLIAPTLTWSPTLGGIQEILQENQDKTIFKTSVLKFTASRLHIGQNISCSAVYKKRDGSSDVPLTTSLMPHVLYSPKNTDVSVSPPGPILENSEVTLTCSSNANPAVKNYTWYRVDGGHETVFGTGRILNVKVSTDRKIIFCKAENYLGEGRSHLKHISVQGMYLERKPVVSICCSDLSLSLSLNIYIYIYIFIYIYIYIYIYIVFVYGCFTQASNHNKMFADE
uniref:Ig-like domain-containing protein n=1 Tax=Fundulus heteroclitus TaxID=8078 RepID=A0A3Q2P4T7_FUNHE